MLPSEKEKFDGKIMRFSVCDKTDSSNAKILKIFLLFGLLVVLFHVLVFYKTVLETREMSRVKEVSVGFSKGELLPQSDSYSVASGYSACSSEPVERLRFHAVPSVVCFFMNYQAGFDSIVSTGISDREHCSQSEPIDGSRIHEQCYAAPLVSVSLSRKSR